MASRSPLQGMPMPDRARPDIVARLHDRAVEEATDYVSAHLDECPGIFDDRNIMGHYICEQFKDLKSGVWLEFGVWTGTSINYFASNLPDLAFYGFDSGQGLPEDWSSGFPTMRGTFNMYKTLPTVPPNVELINGWFKDTVPQMVEHRADDLEKLVCLYIDSDLYSSAVTVLEGLKDYIKPGLLILFDEYLGFPNWRKGEYKAWQQFCSKYGVRYRYRAFHGWMAFIEVTHGT